MYKQASKQKLRIESGKGLLTVEQLWDLSLTDLDKLAVSLERKKNSGSKTFLDVKTEEDKTATLKFAIVLDILQTKVEEDAAARKQIEDKEHNQKILGILAKKKDDSLEKMSTEELEAQLR